MPTIGHVGADNVTEEEGMGIATSIANPFVDVRPDDCSKSIWCYRFSTRSESCYGGNKM